MKYGKPVWLMLASIYITQYIGVAFIMSAAIAILRKQGIALDQLALLNLVVLPLAFKVLYAPIIDKYKLPLAGRYRSWLIIAQAAMASLLMLAGLLDFQTQFTTILAILAIYVFFMSVQDVTIDGLACKLFDLESRKFANSIQFSGNLLGNIIGGGLILMFYPWLDWQGSLTLLAALTSISLLQILFFKEPKSNVEPLESTAINSNLLHEMKGFFITHRRWFLVMALYPIGATCGFALLNPLLVDSGWSLQDIGFVTKIYGSAIGLLSALLATPLINQIGRRKALITVVLIQALALLLMVPLTLGYTDKIFVYSAVTVHFISFPALLVVSATLMMDKAAVSKHKATFFTLQFSFASLLGFGYSALSMTIAQHIGYTMVVIFGVILIILIALLIRILLKNDPESEHAPAFSLETQN